MSECSASIDGWCETHSTSSGPAWCVDSLRDALRRSRFHERENHYRATIAESAVERVRALHAPVGTTLVAVADDLTMTNLRNVDPDSFEEITNRDENCMTCAGYPTWPCATATALAAD